MDTAAASVSCRPRTWARRLSIAALFGCMILPTNPWIVLPEAAKYGLYLALLGVAAIAGRGLRPTLGGGMSVAVAAFVYFHAIAAVRMNPVTDGEGHSMVATSLVMALLTVGTVLVSCRWAAERTPHDVRLFALLILAPAGARLLMNIDQLADYSATSGVGDFRYGSYQHVSVLLGVLTICLLGQLDTGRLARPANAIFALGAAMSAWGVLNVRARGEALALALACLILISPKLAVLSVPFTTAIVSFLGSNLPTSLGERFEDPAGYVARKDLLGKSVGMLVENPALILFGGGHNAFQRRQGVPLGSYPHNVFLEALISGGVLLLIPMLALFVYPTARMLVRGLREHVTRDERFMLALCVYVLVIYSKSRTLLFMPIPGVFAGCYVWLHDRCRVPARATQRPALAAERLRRRVRRFEHQPGVRLAVRRAVQNPPKTSAT